MADTELISSWAARLSSTHTELCKYLLRQHVVVTMDATVKAIRLVSSCFLPKNALLNMLLKFLFIIVFNI